MLAKRKKGMKDLTAQDRKEMADSLREILAELPDREYARAFCWCVLTNFYSGFIAIPRLDTMGRWHPRSRYHRTRNSRP